MKRAFQAFIDNPADSHFLATRRFYNETSTHPPSRHFEYRSLKGANYTYIISVLPLNGKRPAMSPGAFHIYFHL